MSFALTTPQFLDGTKTVTRRMGWLFLKPGDLVLGVEKCQGLKKGEKQKPLGVIRIVSVRRESLYHITVADLVREGFGRSTRREFIDMFCHANRCAPWARVTRIEFERVDDE
jgi:hypothetical protein